VSLVVFGVRVYFCVSEEAAMRCHTVFHIQNNVWFLKKKNKTNGEFVVCVKHTHNAVIYVIRFFVIAFLVLFIMRL
jgi:hypothetical protein